MVISNELLPPSFDWCACNWKWMVGYRCRQSWRLNVRPRWPLQPSRTHAAYVYKSSTRYCSVRVVVKSIYYCASVSEQAFKELSAEDAEPFICFCCFKTKKEKQIDTLQTTVESLKADIESLKAASRSTVTSTVSYSDAVSADRGLLPTLSSMNAIQDRLLRIPPSAVKTYDWWEILV